MALTRRMLLTFLAAVCGAAGVSALSPQDLASFMTSAPPCLPDAKPTTAVAADGTFKEGAPLRPVLADASVAGPRLRSKKARRCDRCLRTRRSRALD
jgi:hypothetical protein